MVQQLSKRVNFGVLRVIAAFSIVAVIILAAYVIISYDKTTGNHISDVLPSAAPDAGTQGVRSAVADYVAEKTVEDYEQERAVIFSLLTSELKNGYLNNVASERVDKSSPACELAKDLTKDTDDELKLKIIADYIYENIQYDWENIILETTGKPRIKSLSSVQNTLDAKRATCGEEANLYMYLLRCIDREAYFVYGGAHAWNVAVLRGVQAKFVEVDTRQHCYGCLIRKPIAGLCDSELCINLARLTAVLREKNIMQQVLGK